MTGLISHFRNNDRLDIFPEVIDHAASFLRFVLRRNRPEQDPSNSKRLKMKIGEEMHTLS
jgi:hypothetical protein